MKAINEEKWEGLDATEVDKYGDSLMKAAENSDILSESLKEDKKAANEVARATTKMNKGIDKLADGYKDWSDVLKNSSKESAEYSEAMDGMKDAMSDVLGVSEEFISDGFITSHLEDIEKAATGDAEAIARL